METILFVKKRENDYLYCFTDSEGDMFFTEANTVEDGIKVSENRTLKTVLGEIKVIDRHEMKIKFNVAPKKMKIRDKVKFLLTDDVWLSMELV